MILQLNPSIPVVTPKGSGEAIGWLSEGKEDHLMWVVLLNDNGQCWQFPNPMVRAQPNWSLGRMVGMSVKSVQEELVKQFPKWSDTKV